MIVSLMADLLSLPMWAFAVPPITAIVVTGLWLRRPRLRRDTAFFCVLVASVGLAAVEAAIFVVLFGIFALFALSGGMEQY